MGLVVIRRCIVDYFKNLLSKLIPKNIAGILGVAQTVISIIKELLMVATRICTTIIPGDADDKIVEKISNIFAKVEGGFEKVKNFLL